MSQGKYSPNYPRNNREFNCNCHGQKPLDWEGTDAALISGNKYDSKTMFGGFDPEGYDSYGYSSFGEDGIYVGIGEGVDRNGITSDEYQVMSTDEYNSIAY